MFFLTEIDPRAKTEGARDPLGMQSVWQGIARTVISNLTTQTSSLTDFRILLVGCYLTERLGDSPGDPFVVWEQLCGQVRYLGGQEGFRGIESVRRKDRSASFSVSTDPADVLLSHQRTNGVWGLYVAATERSGLIADGSARMQLTVSGRDLVEKAYLPHLDGWGPGLNRLLKILKNGGTIRKGDVAQASQFRGLQEFLVGKPGEVERDALHLRIVEGSDVPDVEPHQRGLAKALVDGWHGKTPRASLAAIAESVTDGDLKHRLDVILAVEQLLAGSSYLFAHLAAQGGCKPSAVAAGVAKEWKGRRLLTAAQVALIKGEHGEGRVIAPTFEGLGRDRWLRIADALSARDYEATFGLLLEQNTTVSRDRGASVGWVDLDDDGKLLINRSAGSGHLPAPDSLGSLWVNSYFLSNLAGLAAQLEYA